MTNPSEKSIEDIAEEPTIKHMGEAYASDWGDTFRSGALAALSQTEKEGYVLVPIEPTEEMIREGMAELSGLYYWNGLSEADSLEGEESLDVYKAMLAASTQGKENG